jgi:hypothetical protein
MKAGSNQGYDAKLNVELSAGMYVRARAGGGGMLHRGGGEVKLYGKLRLLLSVML